MDEPVGYKNPPKATRFQKGRSGNPSGRPKKVPSLADDLAAELGQKISITEGGKAQRITKGRALIKSLTNSSLKGNVAAATLLAKIAAAGATGAQDLQPRDLTPAEREIMDAHLKREVRRRMLEEEGGE